MNFWNNTSLSSGLYTPTPQPNYDPETLLTEVTNPVLKNVIFAVRVFLFITCLVENGIAVYILLESVKIAGRKTFAQYMLISIACADILTAFVHYPAIFVQFSHGEFVWLVEGRIGDILCKLYNFLVNLPGKVVSLSLIGLAYDALRDSWSKGRKEYTKKESGKAVAVSWIGPAILSVAYLDQSTVQKGSQFNKCRSEISMQWKVINQVFVVGLGIILAILDIVVLIQVKRRGRELKERKEREREMTKPPSETGDTGRHRHITHHIDGEMHPATSRESCAAEDRVIETSDPSEPPSMGSEILSETVTSAKETGNALGNTEALATDSKTSEVSEASKTHAKRKVPRKEKSKNGVNDVEERDSENLTGQSAEEERFQTTRKKAKIIAAISIPFIILLIVMLILPFVCLSCSIYLLYAILIAGEIFAVIKPTIYDKTDNEFRERYRQLSPFACCCFRRARHCSE